MRSGVVLTIMSSPDPIAVSMTIAGSDSGGGAGIQADLKTFHALGCFGTSAITAITAQNTLGVSGVQGIKPELVQEQIKAILEDFPVGACKTGMLFSTEIIEAVQALFTELKTHAPPLVVDPVMVASSGARLLEKNAEEAMSHFLKSARLITPNLPEAEVLLGQKLNSPEDLTDAARRLFDETGARVLLKGGHRLPQQNPQEALDIYFDGTEILELKHERLESRNTHGTGCTLSAAITAFLARGLNELEAIQKAREYLFGALKNAPDLGKGTGPLNHMWEFPG